MQTKYRISVSLSQNLNQFVRENSKKQNITQSAVVEKALLVLQKLQAKQNLKQAYQAEVAEKENLENFVDVFFEDCLATDDEY